MGKLIELISCISSDHVYIQMHNFPDPDAIASAYSLQCLLKGYGISSTICYYGSIDKYSTNHLIDSLDISLVNITSPSDYLLNDDVILVDVQANQSNINHIRGRSLLCLDHHPITNNTNYKFQDIRPNIGACASIVADYYYDEGLSMSQSVATALSYGIRADTALLSRGVSSLDLEMIYKMFDRIDTDLISSLEHSVLESSELPAYKKAIESISLNNGICFADAGSNQPGSLIACIADFLLNLAHVDIVTVYSKQDDKLRVSMRSQPNSINSGRILEQVLHPFGGDGGGHSNMAAGFIPLESNSINNEKIIHELKQSLVSYSKNITDLSLY